MVNNRGSCLLDIFESTFRQIGDLGFINEYTDLSTFLFKDINKIHFDSYLDISLCEFNPLFVIGVE